MEKRIHQLKDYYEYITTLNQQSETSQSLGFSPLMVKNDKRLMLIYLKGKQVGKPSFTLVYIQILFFL